MATSTLKCVRSPKQYDLPTIPESNTGRTTSVTLPAIGRRGYIMVAGAYAYLLFVINGSSMNVLPLRNDDSYPVPTVTGSSYTYTFDFDSTNVKNVKPFIIGTYND